MKDVVKVRKELYLVRKEVRKQKTKRSERSPETKDLIIDIIKQDPHITAAEIAMQLNMFSRGIEKQIRKLRELGKIKRTGGRFGDYWEIVILDKE